MVATWRPNLRAQAVRARKDVRAISPEGGVGAIWGGGGGGGKSLPDCDLVWGCFVNPYIIYIYKIYNNSSDSWWETLLNK